MNDLSEEDKARARQALLAVVTGSEAGKKGAGHLVETKFGIGRTFHSDDMVNGKICVYLAEGKKMLCRPENLKHLGHVD